MLVAEDLGVLVNMHSSACLWFQVFFSSLLCSFGDRKKFDWVSIFKPKKTAPRSLIKYTIQDDIKLIKPKHILLQDVKLEFLNWLIGSIINKDEMEK